MLYSSCFGENGSGSAFSRHFTWTLLQSPKVTLPVDIRTDFTSQTRNNTNTADNVLETEYFTDNYVDNVRSPVIDIANLSTILDNDLTDLLDVPVCSDLNHLNILKIIITSCVMQLTQTVIFITKYL